MYMCVYMYVCMFDLDFFFRISFNWAILPRVLKYKKITLIDTNIINISKTQLSPYTTAHKNNIKILKQLLKPCIQQGTHTMNYIIINYIFLSSQDIFRNYS